MSTPRAPQRRADVRFVTSRMAAKLVTIALQVARGDVDHNVVEAARRLADEINQKRGAQRRELHAARMRERRAIEREKAERAERATRRTGWEAA